MTRSRPAVLAASALMGCRVVNEEGHALGTLEELMIDLETGLIVHVVISLGSLRGLKGKRIPWPWESIRVDTEKGWCVIEVSKHLPE
ncbi:MAG: PRC-barrel domain containing protein [Bacteroidetes bacterium]|nr:MAG: PRC-barrel domain containing protein [Bacteroidota bacterium]